MMRASRCQSSRIVKETHSYAIAEISGSGPKRDFDGFPLLRRLPEVKQKTLLALSISESGPIPALGRDARAEIKNRVLDEHIGV